MDVQVKSAYNVPTCYSAHIRKIVTPFQVYGGKNAFRLNVKPNLKYNMGCAVSITKQQKISFLKIL